MLSTEIRNPNKTAHEIDLAVTPFGISKAKVLYRGYPHAAIPADTLVLTPNGFKPAGDIKITDQIISGTGRAVSINAISKNPAEPVYETTFKSGRKIHTSKLAMWAPHQNQKGDISDVNTVHDICNRLQRQQEKGINTRLNIFMPVNGPVMFSPTNIFTANVSYDELKALAIDQFKRPMPDQYLTAKITERQLILQFFMNWFGRQMQNWELDIPECWHENVKSQLLFIFRSLGLNIHVTPAKLSGHTCTLKILTCKNLINPEQPPFRYPKPMDFVDEITGTKLTQDVKPMVCIAPQSGTYNFIVEDFCVFHTTLYSGNFEKQIPLMPWGTEQHDKKPLDALYPTYNLRTESESKKNAASRSKPITNSKAKTGKAKTSKKRRSVVKHKK